MRLTVLKIEIRLFIICIFICCKCKVTNPLHVILKFRSRSENQTEIEFLFIFHKESPDFKTEFEVNIGRS